MSRARLAVGGVLMLGVLVGSGAVALAAWPLAVAQAPGEPHVMKFQPAGTSIVASRAEIEFPSGLSQELTGATIMLDAVVNEHGAVSSVRLASLSARNETTGASLSAADIRTVDAMLGGISAGRIQASGPPASMFADGKALMGDLEILAKAASAALQQWRFHRPQAAPAIARVPARFDVARSQASFGAALPLSGFPAPPASNFASAPPPPSADGTLRVGGTIEPPTKVVNVAPVYPKDAQDAGVQGVVIIEAKIDPDGSVAEAWVLRSIPMLDQAALDAVKQWRYTPTLMNGVPVPVMMTMTVNFTLQD